MNRPEPAPTDRILAEAADRFGTPAYVYLTDVIEARIAALQGALGRWFDLSYAMKCNPNPALLAWLKDRVPYIDVSSGGEFLLARSAGWSPERASFTGPAKREVELRRSIAAGLGELVVESLREARLADRIAAEAGRRQDVVIRIAPDRVPKGFGDQMAGRPSPFGIDIEEAPAALAEILALPHLRVAGLHIYSGTQCLKPAAIVENWRIFIGIFRDLCIAHDLHPDRLIFGSGLGIPYHPGDTALDLDEVAAAAAPDLEALKADPRFAGTRLVLELGRYLVGPAGYFVTRVTATKNSRGARIAICDGGMNGHLAASGHFGMVLRRNYVMHRVGGSGGKGGSEEKIDISGPLCTSIDKLGSGVMLPRIDEGDLIAIHASGAYGPTSSPVNFISHPTPREIIAEGGQLIDATRIEGAGLRDD
ncbi:type III PLP-dependent enzyme [Paracoccus spongiarum]|uniref:Type III PLP-dependent enzyme n=1 Tax=Paracoccus spongiarum TaxID=3064387 RepID=A0ABT9J8R3_9RHOB|nr:type III PLP-dependent enzyme [Paracoccus sp. 2205BS29-5]MDP5306194.1 type III PLP-dependent enzyme [Paracoccus sp. 2205BS29-5]